MKNTRLPTILASPLTMIIALQLVSCGKDTKNPAGGRTPANKSGPESQSKDDPSANTINGGQIIVVADIVFKTDQVGKTPYTGLVIWTHDNGERQMESYCKAGRWHGPSKWWYKNGTLAGEGTYDAGIWEGDYKEWHENGKLKVQVTFKDGKEEGKEIWFFENGKVRSVTPYKAGKKDGDAEGYFENGIKNWKAGWVSNTPDGEYWEWYDNGNKKSVRRYSKGRRHGKEEHWFSNEGKTQSGQQQKSWEVGWVNDKKQGIEQHWYPSGIDLKAMTYDKGMLHGQAASWYQNGKLIADGPPPLPQGRKHLWTRQTISDHCKGKTVAQIETLFGNPDATDPDGVWIYRGIYFRDPKTQQPIAATTQFTFKTGKVHQTEISAH